MTTESVKYTTGLEEDGRPAATANELDMMSRATIMRLAGSDGVLPVSAWQIAM